MVLFKKKKDKIIKKYEEELEEIRKRRKEIYQRILASNSESARIEDEYLLDDGYRDMRGIEEIKDIIESARKSKENSRPQEPLLIEEYVCTGCGAVFKDAWERCPRCDGKVVKKKDAEAHAISPSPVSTIPDFGKKESKENEKQNSAEAVLKENNIFSKEVLEGSLYKQITSPSSLPPPAPREKKEKKAKKIKISETKKKKVGGGQLQTCPSCGKTLTKAPPGGWKFCVFCGEKLKK